MIDLREHLQELAEAAARDGRTAGPMAAIRRGRGGAAAFCGRPVTKHPARRVCG